MYKITFARAYKKSIKKLLKSSTVTLREVDIVIDLLAAKKVLPVKYKDHKLVGELDGYRECHVRPDILLFYKIHENELVLLVANIGSHAQLFG